MSKQVITLSNSATNRVKEIIASAKAPIVGVRVGVESGGCAGMSYVIE
jgi:iron-sulfur cluster assembly protein